MDDNTRKEAEKKQKYQEELRNQMNLDDLRRKNASRMTRTEKRINYENLQVSLFPIKFRLKSLFITFF
jgi:hypothetical protein